MFNHRRNIMKATAAWSALAASGQHPAFAQGAETARIFVGFPPGTTPDILARRVGESLAKGYAKAALVDNRTGAGGQLAVTALKTAPQDGYTMMVTAMSILGVYPHTYRKLPYSPFTDVAPVAMGASFDYGIGVGPAVPESVKTLSDLFAWYKANPGNANMASPATGSPLHFTTVMLGRAAGIDITHVGYRGSTAAIQDMLGGTLPALCTPLGTFFNQPKLRVLATTGARRSRFTPNVPTLVESGYKDLVFSEWYGFFAPAGTPAQAIARLNAALKTALSAPDVIETLATFGMDPAYSTPEQLAAALKADHDRWAPIVKSIGFTAES